MLLEMPDVVRVLVTAGSMSSIQGMAIVDIKRLYSEKSRSAGQCGDVNDPKSQIPLILKCPLHFVNQMFY